ncbi:hypothetical protein ABBQ38_009604 [Trebouxia sp. C0009 RCD-2024]
MLLHHPSFRVMAANMTPPQMQPMAASIHKKLTEALKPSMLNVRNDSHKHAGHSGNPSGAPDAETHFDVQVVSEAFSGKRLVQRHKMVYSILDHELKTGVHALALKTKTPEEAAK